MKSVCKSLLLSLVLGITALAPSGLKAQSQPEPSVVVSITNFDKQIADLKYLADAAGFGQEANMTLPMIGAMYGQSIDMSRSAGAMVYFKPEAQIPDVLGFLPIKDMEGLLDMISGMNQQLKIEEDGDIYILTAAGAPPIMVKEQSGYAFITTEKSLLEALPADPAAQLGKLPEMFNLAFRVMPQRIPLNLKEQMMDIIKQSSSQTLEQLDDGLQADLQRKNLEMQMEQLEMVLEQTKELTIGMGIDRDGENTFMDMVFTGVEGSELAKKFADSAPDSPSRFSGFLMEGAAFTMNSNSKVGADDAKIYGDMINDTRDSLLDEMNQEGDFSDEEFEALKTAVSSIFDVVQETLEEGVMDGGAVMMMEPDNMSLAGGFQVSDAAKLENTVKKLVPMIKERAAADDELDVEIKLDNGKYKGITFHEFVFAVPADEEEVRKAVGETLTVAIGVGKKEIYFGAGNQPVELIKSAVDGAKDSDALQQFNVYLAPIMQAVARMDGPPMVTVMAEKLVDMGKDRISAVSRLRDNGVETRFAIENGILSLIRVGYESAMGGGGMPNNEF